MKRRDGWDHPAGASSAAKEVLDLQLTRHTHLVGGSTTLTISIVEQVTRTSLTPTRSEVQARDRYYDSFRVGARAEYPNIPQFD